MSIESEIKRAISSGYDIEIKYKKYNGETSQRIVSNISYNNDFGDYGYNNDHIKGFCHLRDEDRTFRISRIYALKVLPSGPWVYSHSSSPINSLDADTNYPKPLILSEASSPSYSYSSNNSSGKTYNTGNSSNEGCYIATMAYGSYNHPQVMVLRWYRDNVLQKSFSGRLFIRGYYNISPKLVMVLKGHDTINRLIRNILDKYVLWIKKQKISK